MIRISKKPSKRTRTSKILRMTVTPDHLYLPPLQLSFPVDFLFPIDAFLEHSWNCMLQYQHLYLFTHSSYSETFPLSKKSLKQIIMLHEFGAIPCKC